MIDLTPLDVRKKRGDFKRGLRGYDTVEVDTFMELVAERMEELVREKLALEEKVELLDGQVQSQAGREKAVNDALVTAQQLREDIQGQARREADAVIDDARRMAESTVNNAQAEANAILDRAKSDAKVLRREMDYEVEMALREANRRIQEGSDALKTLERTRVVFLKTLREMMQRQMDSLEMEEARPALDATVPELELPPGWRETVLAKGEDEGYVKVPGLLDEDMGGLAGPPPADAGSTEGGEAAADAEPAKAAKPGKTGKPAVGKPALGKPVLGAAAGSKAHSGSAQDDPATDSGTEEASVAEAVVEEEARERTPPAESVDEEGFEVREYGAWTEPLVGGADDGDDSGSGRGDQGS
jgi:cell division initiation protein